MSKFVNLDRQCQQCFIDAAHRIADRHHMPEHVKAPMIEKVREAVAAAGPDTVPPRVARVVFPLIAEALGVDDPFVGVKEEANIRAGEIAPELRRRIETADDPFAAAVRIALAGNAIDFVFRDAPDLLDSVENLMAQELGIDEIDRLRDELQSAERVLMFGDNVGETWCDRLLIERFPPHVNVEYAVRSVPVLNDATLPDARAAGIDEMAEVFPSGSDAPGTLLDLVTDDTRERFARADVVISKGQGNFEALYGRADRPIYFLFLVKCLHVENIIGQPKGKGIIWRWSPE